MRDLVFVASPLRAETPEQEKVNKEFARSFCRRLWEHNQEVGFAPHLYFLQFLEDQDEEERYAGMQCGFNIMRICEKMYVVGPTVSEGMEDEIGIAQELEIPIIYVPDVDAFFAHKNHDTGLWGLRWLWNKIKSILSLAYETLRSWLPW